MSFISPAICRRGEFRSTRLPQPLKVLIITSGALEVWQKLRGFWAALVGNLLDRLVVARVNLGHRVAKVGGGTVKESTLSGRDMSPAKCDDHKEDL